MAVFYSEGEKKLLNPIAGVFANGTHNGRFIFRRSGKNKLVTAASSGNYIFFKKKKRVMKCGVKCAR